jgi:uncharacterized damage-inducible protein DinB
MTAHELAEILVEESGYQISACLNGVSDENFDAKPIATMMSLRESLEHMLEVFVAIQADVAGAKYEWGTFEAPALGKDELVEMFNEERSQAVAVAIERVDSTPHLVNSFLVGHEFYHVGQMAAVRAACDSDWNSYALYRH